MRQRIAVFIILFFVTGIISCTSNVSKQQKEAIPPQGKHFAPGTVEISGRIISIDSTRMSEDPKEPCGKYPCWAMIKVESVAGYGAGAPHIGQGDTLETKFAFTLGPATKDLFPNLKVNMPGLQKGSLFSASVRPLMTQNMDNKNHKSEYLIYTYSKTE